jgi:hypothetical protein
LAGAIGPISLIHAEQAPKTKSAPRAAQAAPAAALSQAETPPASAPAPGRIARCTSASRDAPLECAIEQTLNPASS